MGDVSGFPYPAPPACFFTLDGLAGQLASPAYVGTLEEIVALLSTFNVPLSVSDATGSRPIKWMSDNQRIQYEQQIALFRRVYAYNQCAYSTGQALAKPPTYYKFITYDEYNKYRGSIETINKLYGPNWMRFLFGSNIAWPPYGTG